MPLIQRGDVVLLQLLARQSLEYEEPPRIIDQSYYPHPDHFSRDEWHFPYRPAVVRAVSAGTETFKLDVYPLMRRPDGLDKISSQRRHLFILLPTILKSRSEPNPILENIYVYKTSLRISFRVQYDQV
jgi:hypothetical protein